MTKVIRQKLGSSKTRLSNKIKQIQEVLKVEESDVSPQDAVKYKLDIGKKIDTFRRHITELEESCKGDDDEENRFIDDYDALEDLLNSAEELQTELDILVKSHDDQTNRQVSIQTKEMDNQLELTKEKLKLNLEFENNKLQILSTEKIELERINLDKLKIEPISHEDETQRLNTNRRLGISVPGIKLPKYALLKFGGDILKWQEFWDSYEASIHNNSALQPVDKFNYLKVQLIGEAKDVNRWA